MRLSISLAIPLLLAGGTAMAQEAVVEGKGYGIGEGAVLHATAGADTGIDSNVFFDDANLVVAPVLRVLTSVSIASEYNRADGDKSSLESVEDSERSITGDDIDNEIPDPDWDFRVAARIGYNQYISAGHDEDVAYAVSEQSNFHGGLDVHVESKPRGQFSFFFDNDLVRDRRPRNFISAGNLNRWNNQLALGAHYRPGRGALDFSLRYENMIDRFDGANSPQTAQLANRMNHLLRAKAEWQFLPITRFFFDGSFGFFGPLGANSEKVSSTPLRLQVGVASLITETTSVRAHVGFGKGFYSAGQDFTMALYGAEFGWRYSPVGRFTAAFEYDFRDSINSNFYRDYALVTKVDHQIERFLIDVGAQLRLRGFRGVFASINPANPSRDDIIIATHAKVQYLVRDWLAFTGLFDLVVDKTGFLDVNNDDPSYTRVEFVVGAVAAF